ncbi:MAG: hypothetical protein U0L47_08140, partial [Paludibacteraceae bacterium]|nr:hypothetical protein [Paludibacteraceae bacterium]
MQEKFTFFAIGGIFLGIYIPIDTMYCFPLPLAMLASGIVVESMLLVLLIRKILLFSVAVS